MAGYQFDELTKDLAGAKSRRGFLKGLVSAGLAAAGVGTVLSGVASAAPCPSGHGLAKCGSGCCTPAQCCAPKGNHSPHCCPSGTHCADGGCV